MYIFSISLGIVLRKWALYSDTVNCHTSVSALMIISELSVFKMPIFFCFVLGFLSFFSFFYFITVSDF